MGVLKFIGKIINDTIARMITAARSTASGIMGLCLLVWLLTNIAFAFIYDGNLLMILLLPVTIVLSMFYGMFLLIST